MVFVACASFLPICIAARLLCSSISCQCSWCVLAYYCSMQGNEMVDMLADMPEKYALLAIAGALPMHPHRFRPRTESCGQAIGFMCVLA